MDQQTDLYSNACGKHCYIKSVFVLLTARNTNRSVTWSGDEVKKWCSQSVDLIKFKWFNREPCIDASYQKIGGSNPSQTTPCLDLQQCSFNSNCSRGAASLPTLCSDPNFLTTWDIRRKVFHSTVMHMRHIKSSSSNDIRAISIQQGERKWIDFMKDTLESEEGSHASSGDTQHALINANRVRRAANIQKPSELQSHTQINHLLPHSSPDNRSVAYGYQTSGLVKQKKIFV